VPLPLIGLPAAIGAVLNLRNGFIVGGAFALFKDEIIAAVYQVLEGQGAQGYITEKINNRLSAAGVDMSFGNVFDLQQTKSDVDKFVAERINAKAGTNFQAVSTLTRDEFLEEVGRKIGSQVSNATGANILTVYPVERLRAELGTELQRQFDPGVDLGNGALFKREILAGIEQRIYAKFKAQQSGPLNSFWPPPNDEKHAARRAKGRARQAKYRRSHKLAWVAK
jgi:hypothetical protein